MNYCYMSDYKLGVSTRLSYMLRTQFTKKPEKETFPFIVRYFFHYDLSIIVTAW